MENRNNQLYSCTLDIDKNDKDFISRIEKKIINCEYLHYLEKRPSAFKGYHFLLECLKKCDICRIVYDDFRRLAYDLNRPYYARNILFDKEIYPNEKTKMDKWRIRAKI